jgi:hypothetical protein
MFSRITRLIVLPRGPFWQAYASFDRWWGRDGHDKEFQRLRENNIKRYIPFLFYSLYSSKVSSI